MMNLFEVLLYLFFFSSRRRHTRSLCDWSSDVCSSDLLDWGLLMPGPQLSSVIFAARTTSPHFLYSAAMKAANLSTEPPPSSTPYPSKRLTTSGMASTRLMSALMRWASSLDMSRGPTTPYQLDASKQIGRAHV